MIVENKSEEIGDLPEPIYGEYIHKGNAICPECGCNFEIKEFKPIIMSFSDEGIKIQNAIDSVKKRRNINNTIISIIGVILAIFFLSIDINQFQENTHVITWVLWIISCLLRIMGIYFLCRFEIMGFEKLMKKYYPIAYNP